MMNAEQNKRLSFLTAAPVLSTFAGARARVRQLSVGDLMLLTNLWDVDVDALASRLRAEHRRRGAQKGKRKKKRAPRKEVENAGHRTD